MANAVPVDNVRESLIRNISGVPSWLMSIESKDDVRMLDAVAQIGNANYTVIDDATANTTDKTSTAVVADKGVRHTVSTTTANYYQPVKYYDQEVVAMQRNGTLQKEMAKDAIKQKDAVFKAISAILVDALSDGALTKTATLADGSTNFAASSLTIQAANLLKYSAVMGEVSAQNGGFLPDWILALPEAWGNLVGYSNQNTTAIRQVGTAGPTPFTISGIPMWSQPNGTGSKWGAASKPCLLMGANRHLVFRIRDIFVGETLEFQTSTGVWVLPVGLTVTYGVDFTGTTGLALGIGEVINGVS